MCIFVDIVKIKWLLPCVYSRISYKIQFYLNLAFLAMENAVLEKKLFSNNEIAMLTKMSLFSSHNYAR